MTVSAVPGTLGAAALHRAVEAGEVDPVDAVEAHLAHLKSVDASLRAVVALYEDDAVTTAKAQREQIAAGLPGGPLRGVPVMVKDLYDVEGRPTRSGSRASSAEPAATSSGAVTRLAEAGANLVGKTTTHEYAYGVTTPPTRNPWDLGRVPGGSSGGSGAIVAAGGVGIALGTDTGGSIRIPAALCGVVGIKPTYGRVSKRGITVCSYSLDHAGPLAATVEDAAVALTALAGFDPLDPFSADVPTVDHTAELGTGVQGLRLGVSEDYFCDRLDPDVAAAFESALRVLESAGATLVDVSVPSVWDAPDIVTTIAGAEAASYHRERMAQVPDLLQDDVVAALREGAEVSGSDFVEAQLAKAAVTGAFARLYTQVDALVSPTVAMTAPPFGATTALLGGVETPVLPALNALTVPANVTGMPALTVPAGPGADGLPVGFQIMTARWQESLALRIGAELERRTTGGVPVRPALAA
jgi:aspartyl-tRNA(Asn)/glutamyl-tRNA(Gln) amidotransferase subunit A